MKTDVRLVVMECFFDLGITIVYASLVGLVIVAVVASDDGRGSLLETLCYTALLPASVFSLILIEIALRLIKERRALRKHLRADRSNPSVRTFRTVMKFSVRSARHRLRS